MSRQHIETLIVGAGQAGLATGYHLQRLGRPFLIVDSNERVGDNWRQQWDTLRLYTPAKYDGLPGLPFPGDARSFPGKDGVADYLESYALHWDLPVRMSTRIDALEAGTEGGFAASVGADTIACDNVVVATGTFGRTPTSRTSRQSWTRRCVSCTPASTAGPASCNRARCWSSAPRTPERISPTR